MVSVIVPFKFLHDFPLHSVCGNGGRVVSAQSLHGTGVDEIAEDNADFFS